MTMKHKQLLLILQTRMDLYLVWNIKRNKIGHYEVRVTQSVVFFVVFCITLFVLAGFGHDIL
jgi:hypothetical protein